MGRWAMILFFFPVTLAWISTSVHSRSNADPRVQFNACDSLKIRGSFIEAMLKNKSLVNVNGFLPAYFFAFQEEKTKKKTWSLLEVLHPNFLFPRPLSPISPSIFLLITFEINFVDFSTAGSADVSPRLLCHVILSRVWLVLVKTRLYLCGDEKNISLRKTDTSACSSVDVLFGMSSGRDLWRKAEKNRRCSFLNL
jgi:hypothetical protein